MHVHLRGGVLGRNLRVVRVEGRARVGHEVAQLGEDELQRVATAKLAEGARRDGPVRLRLGEEEL